MPIKNNFLNQLSSYYWKHIKHAPFSITIIHDVNTTTDDIITVNLSMLFIGNGFQNYLQNGKQMRNNMEQLNKKLLRSTVKFTIASLYYIDLSLSPSLSDFWQMYKYACPSPKAHNSIQIILTDTFLISFQVKIKEVKALRLKPKTIRIIAIALSISRSKSQKLVQWLIKNLMFNRVDAKKISGIDSIAIDTEFELFWHIFVLLVLINKIIRIFSFSLLSLRDPNLLELTFWGRHKVYDYI